MSEFLPGIAGKKVTSIREPTRTVLLAEVSAFHGFSWHGRSTPPIVNNARAASSASSTGTSVTFGFIGTVTWAKPTSQCFTILLPATTTDGAEISPTSIRARPWQFGSSKTGILRCAGLSQHCDPVRKAVRVLSRRQRAGGLCSGFTSPAVFDYLWKCH